MIHRYCFLGGAPKCGTSSLFYWLSTHPSLSPSYTKETFFLIDKDNPLASENKNIHNSGFEEFLEYFNDKNKLLLEGTTHLLYQKQVIEFIEKKCPKAKFIFVLRNPIDRLLSSFNYTKNNLLRINEELDFNGYVSILQTNNRNQLKKYIKDERSLYVLSRDLEYGMYSNYLKPWVNIFGRENIEIKIFEDLKENSEKEIFNTCQFLGIDENHFKEFNYVTENESLIIKHKSLFKMAKKFKKVLPAGRRLKKQIKKLFADNSGSQVEEINQENRVFLEDYYKNETLELRQLGVISSFPSWPKNNLNEN